MLKIRHSIKLQMSIIRQSTDALRMSNISTFDRRPIECRKSDIRRRALQMSNIRHSTDSRLNVENPTSEEGCFGCRIFDIRRAANRMLKIRHPKKGASNVQYSTFDGGQYRFENRIESFCIPLMLLPPRVVCAWTPPIARALTGCLPCLRFRLAAWREHGRQPVGARAIGSVQAHTTCRGTRNVTLLPCSF